MSATEQKEFEDYVKKLDEVFQRQQGQKREEAKRWYRSHFRIDRHQKVVQEREVKLASLTTSLQQPPTVNNSDDDIQSLRYYINQQEDQLKRYLDLQIETLKKLRSYGATTKVLMPSTSVANGIS